MKKIIFALSFLIPFLTYSQKIYYQNADNKFLNEKEYAIEKQKTLKTIQSQFGKEYDIEETTNLQKSSKDSLVYSFQITPIPKELKLEKERLKQNLNKELSIKNLEFLNSEEKEKIDFSKPTFINFWFTACPPCIEEIPALNELKQKYEGKVNFVSITFNDKIQVEKFLTKFDYQFIHIINQKTFIENLGINGYPKSFILDKNQKIQYIEDGLPGKEQEQAYKILITEMENKIEKLLL